DLDWDRPGEEAVQDYAKGMVVKVKLLEVDVEKERISLGIKQLESDPFEADAGDIKKGDVVTCTVREVHENGIEVELNDGAIGFIRKAELARERSEQRPDRYAPGEKVDAKVTAVDRKTRRISLSIKQLQIEEEKQAMAEYGSTESGASLGDILGAAIAKQRQEQKKAEERSEERRVG